MIKAVEFVGDVRNGGSNDGLVYARLVNSSDIKVRYSFGRAESNFS